MLYISYEIASTIWELLGVVSLCCHPPSQQYSLAAVEQVLQPLRVAHRLQEYFIGILRLRTSIPAVLGGHDGSAKCSTRCGFTVDFNS